MSEKEFTVKGKPFNGKDLLVGSDRFDYQKNSNTVTKIIVNNAKGSIIGENPTSYIPLITPNGTKYIPVYSQKYGSSGSRGPYSNITTPVGRPCNLCYSNCNKNYSNYNNCTSMCDTTCNACNSCQGCQGCDACQGCQGCTECQSCNSGCQGCNECDGGCYKCTYCLTCQGGCYGCVACDGEGACRGCYGSHNCYSGNCEPNNYVCCDGSCDSCDGHGPQTGPGYVYGPGPGKIAPKPCSNTRICTPCYTCNSCNSGCNGTCNSCNACDSCQGCVECETCVSCQSCNSECYEENSGYDRLCGLWYANSRSLNRSGQNCRPGYSQ